jgi:hypothetical protein
LGVDWWRGRGEGKDYGVQIISHFGIVVFNNQQMLQVAMEAGGGLTLEEGAMMTKTELTNVPFCGVGKGDGDCDGDGDQQQRP